MKVCRLGQGIRIIRMSQGAKKTPYTDMSRIVFDPAFASSLNDTQFPDESQALGVPVVWLIIDSDVVPPFGDVIHIYTNR